MASHSLGLGATLLSLVSTSLSMQPTNGVQFLFPTQGVTLHYNDYVQVQYTSDFTDPWLFTFCESADGDVGQKQKQGVGSKNNTATVKLDWPGSDTPCWFDLKPNSSASVGAGANSDQWSFDVSQRAATTVGLISATTISGTTGGGTTTTTTSAGTPDAASSSTSTPTPSQSSSPSGGLSTGAQAGIGVGAGIVGIVLGAAVAVVYMRRRRAKKRTQVGAAIEAGGKDGSGYRNSDFGPKQSGDARVLDKAPVAEAEGQYPVPQEMEEGLSGPYELSSTGHG